ncbi:hypothetical protein yc1106_05092 [Curvularia clavata]|uniref:N-acetyltransferase domain-containing protein n=1 Tax=Curvularia clavata TaxID=95742 RepID=A0A9Q8ZBM5_CURCL|nr:hypothetical protein yc1106_05092 [Curvularia clavata]
MAHSPATLEWRPLSPNDTAQVVKIASSIHQDLPERDAVFEERITLFPEGCLGLFKTTNQDQGQRQEQDQQLCGYILSHPIPHHSPPSLDTLLTQIAPNATQYYIHDLAILAEFRGSGLAQRGVEKVLETAAKEYETSSLVSVYGTSGFWGRFGFRQVDVEEKLREKVRGYGEEAVFLERKN